MVLKLSSYVSDVLPKDLKLSFEASEWKPLPRDGEPQQVEEHSHHDADDAGVLPPVAAAVRGRVSCHRPPRPHPRRCRPIAAA